MSVKHRENILIIENDTSWSPPSFYDASTNLIWIQTYKLFTDVYSGLLPLNLKKGTKYAIHKDVYHAFLFQYREKKKREKGEKGEKQEKGKIQRHTKKTKQTPVKKTRRKQKNRKYSFL